jgi:hypothetical protein
MAAKIKTCRRCGQTYTGFLCSCRRRGKRGGRPRSAISVGCGTRSWSLASARMRMLGGWDAGAAFLPEATVGTEAGVAGPEDAQRDEPER